MWDSFSTKYKVLKKIGEGSFSEVLQCENRLTGEKYAAKKLKKMYRTQEEIENCAELVASKKIKHHPNVLNLIEHFYDTFTCKVVLVFELMDLSMYDYVRTRTRLLPEYKVKRYLYQMLRGLDHLHKQGLFHRDIKPENILIKFEAIHEPLGPELIKIADLGSVRGTFSVPPYTEYISTRWYRSPECLLTVGQYGPKMDVWAAGCVFYEMMTSKPLFAGANEVDQLRKIHDILGVPGLNILKKLRNRSQNFIKFEATKPKGIDFVAQPLSLDARGVLKSMIQYDPDKRINVGRLLNNEYFNEFRLPPRFFHKQNVTQTVSDKIPIILHKHHHYRHRESKDFTSSYDSFQLSNKSSKMSKGSKTSTFSQLSKDSSACSHFKFNYLPNKIAPARSVEIERSHDLKKNPKTDQLKGKERSRPAAKSNNFSVLKSWEVNTNAVQSNKDRSGAGGNRIKQRNVQKSSLDSFRKTTSDIQETTKKLIQPNDVKRREFISQSFVSPWRSSGANSLYKGMDKSISDQIRLATIKRMQIKRRVVNGV